MLLSLILAWITVLFAILTAFKWIARISGNRTLNRYFRKIHIPFGMLMLVTGMLHGILAGNPASATLHNFTFAPVLFTWNWGTACLVIMLSLALTYLLRQRLRKRWMTAHRILTVALIAILILHITGVGVQIFHRLSDRRETRTAAVSGSGAPSADSSSTESPASSGKTPPSPSDASSGSVVTFSGATLKDGTYQGSADGYNGTIAVSVTVSGGRVTKISVNSENDTDRFFSSAESVLDTIVNQQSLDVDAVSGATFSSAGLINAVSDALQSAVTSGTLKVNNINFSAAERRGH